MQDGNADGTQYAIAIGLLVGVISLPICLCCLCRRFCCGRKRDVDQMRSQGIEIVGAPQQSRENIKMAGHV